MDTTDQQEATLRETLTAISRSIDVDNIRQLDCLADNIHLLDTQTLEAAMRDQVEKATQFILNGDLDMFHFTWLSQRGKMTDGLLQKTLPGNSNAHFLIKNYAFVLANFKGAIRRSEGMCCCADKARAVLHRLLRYFVTDQEVTFSDDEPYTFHHPTVIFTTHNEIVEFFEKLRLIFYGVFPLEQPDQPAAED